MISNTFIGKYDTYICAPSQHKNILIGTRQSDGLKVTVKKVKQAHKTYKEAYYQFSTINFSNVAATLDLIEKEDELFVVREYYEGTSLKHVLDKKSIYRKLNERFFIDLIIVLLKALNVLHQRNVLHLDIKPANIIIRHEPDENPLKWKSDNIVIIDFEQSLCFPVPKYMRNRFTLVYSPPEQLLNRLFMLSPASDISAVGIILYEVISGSAPYVDCNAEILLNLQLTYPIKKRPSMRDEFFEIVKKATNKEAFPKPPRLLDYNTIDSILSKGIAGRYQKCSEFIEALENYILLIKDKKPNWWQKLLRRLNI